MSETTPDAPIVTLFAGRVRGAWRGTHATFLGIPFAQPPVGELRFSAPVPVEPWQGVRDALEYGATPQRWVPAEPTLIPEPSVPGASTLNVNVHTPLPGDGDARLPVLVWIHGGGYVSGSPASPWYNDGAFARDGVVTVVVSYRLGFDGFGWIDGAPQNRGVLDWIAALEWVRDNIAAFGGNPADVTIAGQSAGGGAVLTLLGLPSAQHLFHRAISISGAVADIPAERAKATAARLASKLGVPATRAGFTSVTEKAVERVQVSVTRSEAKGLAAARALLDGATPYGPVVDGRLIAQPTVAAIAAGIGADKPLVLGATDDEFSMVTDAYRGALRFIPPRLALRALGIPAPTPRDYVRANRGLGGTAAVLGRFVTDRFFRSLVLRVADARGAAPTWAYRFSWRSRSRGSALHCLDVPFWFDCLHADGVAALAGVHPPQTLADELHGAALAFVRSGEPGWPAWSEHPGTARVFDDEPGTPDVLPDAFASARALA